MALKTLITIAAIAGIAASLLNKNKASRMTSRMGHSSGSGASSGDDYSSPAGLSGSSSGAYDRDGTHDHGSLSGKTDRQD